MLKNKLIGYYGYWVYLTYLSVISAIIGIYFAISKNIFLAIVCLMISGVCDMFDGTVAKTKKRNDDEKKYGIQIDALADIVSFGILPALIGLAYFNVGEMKLQDNNISREYYEGLPVTSVALIIPLVYSICTFFNIPLDIVFNKLYLIILILFITKIKIPKLKGKKLFILLFLGTIILSFMIIIKYII